MTAPFDLQQHLANYFRSEAGRFQLDAGSLNLEREFNDGGFGSHSYRVGDGERSIHVKLATDQREMRRWLAVHDWLDSNYCAPKVLEWADVPGTPYGGLVFEYIDGKTWDTATRPGLVADLRSLLERLHGDGCLAQKLGDGPRGYRHCWEMRYREQFEEDLKPSGTNRAASGVILPSARCSARDVAILVPNGFVNHVEELPSWRTLLFERVDHGTSFSLSATAECEQLSRCRLRGWSDRGQHVHRRV
jgi:hypothetical protein